MPEIFDSDLNPSKHPYKSKFIAVEGIDGAGKGIAVEAMRRWAIEMGLKCFDMELFCKKHHRLPYIQEIEEPVIISKEPTFAPIGKTLRDILARKKGYSAETLAHAFALDREIYFKEVIIPARKANKFIFQERSVFSTLAYQGLMKDNMMEYMMKLEGNILALRNSPDHVIVVTTEIDEAMKRINKRSVERNLPISLFENPEFLTRVQERFQSDWMKEMAQLYDTSFTFKDNSPPKSIDSFQHDIIKLMNLMRLS